MGEERQKYLDEGRQRYLNGLYQILDTEYRDYKNEMLKEMYTGYAKFCYYNNLSTYDSKLFEKSESLFIIESEPIDYQIDNQKKNEALARLQSALVNIQNGYPDGISLDDAKLIIESIIQNARVGLCAQEKDSMDFFNSSFGGFCGYAQALTIFPLLELGVKVTANNVSKLPDCSQRHAFATCTFPIKEENQIYEKQFLLDATYRQFFLTINCNEGRFYEGDARFKNQTGADPGYHLCQSEVGILFAEELSRKGYIELTEENARMYGYGFSAQTITLSTVYPEILRISNHTGREYIDAINNKQLQEKLDYDREEFRDWDVNISLFNLIDTIRKNNNVMIETISEDDTLSEGKII